LGVLPHILFKLSWLWFLPCLFFALIVNYPFLRWIQRRKSGIELCKEDLTLVISQMLIIGKVAIIMHFKGGSKELLFSSLVVGASFVVHYLSQIMMQR